MLTSLDEYFQQLFRMAKFCTAVRSTQLCNMDMTFLSTNISQGSVAMHLRGCGIFYYRFTTNLLPSLSAKVFENRPAFGNVSGKKYSGTFFILTRCITLWIPKGRLGDPVGFIPHGIPRGIKPGPIFYRIAGRLCK